MRLQVFIEPARDFFQPAHAVTGLAAAGKLVVFPMEQAHAHRGPGADGSGIHRHGFRQRRSAQAAQLVLLESDFSCMPQVVLEGRRVVNNIQRSATLFLVKNIFRCC